MKKNLSTLLLMCALTFMSTPSVLAANDDKSSSSFNVREILTISDESGTGEESINQTFIDKAEAEGTSVAELLILRVINILSLLIGTDRKSVV